MGKIRIIKKTEQKESKKEVKEIKTKVSSNINEGCVYIQSTYNNTLITLTDLKGNVLGWNSAGRMGFSGTKKSTPFVASKVVEAICQVIKKLKIEKIHIFVKGIGSGREAAIRSLAAHDLNIISIKDITPIPHNGCKPRKPRRV